MKIEISEKDRDLVIRQGADLNRFVVLLRPYTEFELVELSVVWGLLVCQFYSTEGNVTIPFDIRLLDIVKENVISSIDGKQIDRYQQLVQQLLETAILRRTFPKKKITELNPADLAENVRRSLH